MLLLIDNYDSFTYNLAQYLGELGQEVSVVRNDEISVEEIVALRPERLVLSPGPCTPAQSGVCLEVLGRLAERARAPGKAMGVSRATGVSGTRGSGSRAMGVSRATGPGGAGPIGGAGLSMPILGVCLGHQVIAQAFGGKVVRAERAIHGQVWPVYPVEGSEDPLFSGMPRPFLATRYHSLVVAPASLPGCLIPTAFTAQGEIMALSHRWLPIFGVQFHPESIGTPEGRRLLGNFLAVPALG